MTSLTNPFLAQAQKDLLERNMSEVYTLMPMFLPQAPDSLEYENLLWAMTKDQGYEAHCASMEWYLDKELYGAINKFFSQDIPPMQSFYHNLAQPTVFEGYNDPYIVDLTRARIPMMRGLENRFNVMKNSSLEGMFGANQNLPANNYNINASGISENLLTTYQQCLVKAQNILASSQICDESINEDCGLNKDWSFDIIVDDSGNSRRITDPNHLSNLAPEERVENVAFHTNELKSWFAEIRPDLKGNELYEQVCYDITGGDSTVETSNYDPPTVDPIKIAKLREAISEVAIDLDVLYRLAFLVISPQQNPTNNRSDDKFHWLQAKSIAQADSPAHAPIFIAFKIPDFGANKSRIAGNIDSLTLTKMVLQTKEQNDKDLADQTVRREKIYEAAKRAAQMEIDKKVMKCPASYPQCSRTSENALNNVLEDMINGIGLLCQNDTLRIIEKTVDDNGEEIDVGNFSFNENQAVASAIEMIFNQEDLNWENAGDLFTPANKDIISNEYRGEINTYIANRLSPSKTNLFDWRLTIDENPPILEAPIKVNAYLIVPLGESLKDANKAMSIFWQEDEFFDMIRNNIIEDMITESGKSKMGAIPKHYPIKDAIVGFEGIDSIKPNDECVIERKLGVNGQYYNEYVCKTYEFGVDFNDNFDKALIPDFGLGFMVRKIQQVLRTTYDASYNYIRSCQRVEDMFLGRCSGDPEGDRDDQSFCDGTAFKNIKDIPDISRIPQEARNTFLTAIAPKLTPELIEAYQYAEEQTGVPCEVVAGIHWTEGGLDPNKSVWDGSALRGGSLKNDAAGAMDHMLGFWPGGKSNFDKNNIPYQSLVTAISGFNGPVNMNCSSDQQNNPRPTRWRQENRCEAQFQGEDQPHPLGWIDERHSNMDLIYCIDRVEFSCQTSGTDVELQNIGGLLREQGWDESSIATHLQLAKDYCFSSSSICQTLSAGNKYPRYDRPGSLTAAILINDAGATR